MSLLKKWCVAMAVAVIFNSGVCVASAQDGKDANSPPAAGRQTFAMVDVAYIFDHFPPAKEKMENLKKEVTQAENELKKKVNNLEETKKKLDRSERGSMAYVKLDADLTLAQKEIQTTLETQRKDFLIREAQLHNDTYAEFQREVEEYAKSHGISAVLRISRDTADHDNPQSILNYITRSVVYVDPGLDITQAILDRMIEKSKKDQPEKEPEKK
jgi:Skp family chaperone for outer membrane proteins